MTQSINLLNYIETQLHLGNLSFDDLMKLRSTDILNIPLFKDRDRYQIADELTAIQGKYARQYIEDQISSYVSHQRGIVDDNVKEIYQREVKNSMYFFPKKLTDK